MTLTDISLDYKQLRALRRINLTLGYSEVHAVVGEHGAGKSSLGMIINGMLKPKSGTMTFEGKNCPSLTVTSALKIGIRMIYQQVSLYDHLTVAENLFLSNKAVDTFAWNKTKRFIDATNSLLSQYEFELDPSTLLGNLNLSDKTLVEILKNIHAQPKLLILDEALERLVSPVLNKVMHILMDLKRRGMSILFITHRIDDVYHFADKVSIIKNGEVLVSDYVKNIDKFNLIKVAYTQVSSEQNIENLNTEFRQFLKYNEAILRNLPVNLLVTDNNDRIKMINDYCKRSFHLNKPSYLNVPLAQFFSSHNKKVLELLDDAFSSKEEKTFYQVVIKLHDIKAISNLRTFPIFDGTVLIGHIIVIEDITEYDYLQKQVMLSEKLASVGLLAAGVAHEINNPLEIIYNYLSYIKYNFHGKKLHEAIDNVHEEVSDIAAIVSNLHSFSDNKHSISEEIDLNEILRNMLDLVKHNARHKRIRISCACCEETLVISANKNEIKQVILNLLKNSFEAMPSGGEIFIESSLVRDDEVNVVQVRFQDTGPGIDDENSDNIFLPFYSTKKGIDQNLGLGLSVSYGILKKYNGTIKVENLETGCQFLIQLPQADVV